MSIVSRIDADAIAALKEGKSDRVGVLRLIKSSLKNEQIKLGHELTEVEEIAVLRREAKQRLDAIATYETAGRADRVASEGAEIEIIKEYLPAEMDEAELESIIDGVIAETGATTRAQMGQVMGQVMAKTGGRADGSTVSRLVATKLV